MLLRAIIIDDETKLRSELKSTIQAIDAEIEVLAEADNIDNGYELIISQKPDILFLDIEMPGGSGLELVPKITHLDIPVVFVTAHNDYAINALKIGAIDYLLKPVNKEELETAIQKVMDKISSKHNQILLENLVQNLNTKQSSQRKIALPLTQGFEFVTINEIIRCESSDNYTFVVLTNGNKLLISKTLKDTESSLNGNNFYRTHQSHLINAEHIKSYFKADGGYFILSDGSEIPVSKRRKILIQEIIDQFN